MVLGTCASKQALSPALHSIAQHPKYLRTDSKVAVSLWPDPDLRVGEQVQSLQRDGAVCLLGQAEAIRVGVCNLQRPRCLFCHCAFGL